MKKKKSQRTKQVGVLPVRTRPDGETEVLLVTTRETKRWVIPKGWTSSKLKDYEAAAREAYEEAGITGKTHSKPLGTYQYFKRRSRGFYLINVAVFILEVEKVRKKWPEREMRKRAWFSVKDASEHVTDPSLMTLIKSLQS